MISDSFQNDSLLDEFEQSFNLKIFPKPLDKSFSGRGEVKGHSFLQIAYQNETYIYEVCDPFGIKRYEVFKQVINTRFGQIAYPKSNAFGITAWTFDKIQKAQVRFDNIIKTNYDEQE